MVFVSGTIGYGRDVVAEKTDVGRVIHGQKAPIEATIGVTVVHRLCIYVLAYSFVGCSLMTVKMTVSEKETSGGRIIFRCGVFVFHYGVWGDV